MPELHRLIDKELRELYRQHDADGSLISGERLQGYLDAFRREFGPETLAALEGKPLLERMHDHGNKASLVYWMEFKNDDEFPGIGGGIAGGSAFKFGVYRRKETGGWAVQGADHQPKDIPLERAIEIASRHRDQLLSAASLLSRSTATGEDATFIALQRELERIAPDVQDSAWGHKYLSLLFPDLLDDFHIWKWQHYHLVRLLQLPPESAGRYVCAGRFGDVARLLGMRLPVLTALLNSRHGTPRGYWRIGTARHGGKPREQWPAMRDGHVVAIGFPLLGDLSEHTGSKESRAVIMELVQTHYPKRANTASRQAGEITSFLARISDGDRVFAADGQNVLGVGEVAGPYAYDPHADFPHQRSVKWKSLVDWTAVDKEGLQKAVASIKGYRAQLEVERHILEDAETVSPPMPPNTNPGSAEPITPTPGPLQRLCGVPGQVQSVLERKGQAIVFGPPGTGKTFWALRTARDLAALRAFRGEYQALNSDQKLRVIGGARDEHPLVRMATFHPAYGYEDFIEGYRPGVASSGQLTFTLTPGIFRDLCEAASTKPELDFYLLIDEINRGDIPRIFGELLTLLERDKRGEFVTLSSSGATFRVPPNVYLIGTMNTADRSIALLDMALRRRFGFVELMPDYSVLKGAVVGGLALGPWLEYLNSQIRAMKGADARNRQIGHAFLLNSGRPITTVEQLAAVMRDDIAPLLEEYCYEDFEELGKLLGTTLVDITRQRVRSEYFEPGRGADLANALQHPSFATASDAVVAAATEEALDDDDGDDAPADSLQSADPIIGAS